MLFVQVLKVLNGDAYSLSVNIFSKPTNNSFTSIPLPFSNSQFILAPLVENKKTNENYLNETSKLAFAFETLKLLRILVF